MNASSRNALGERPLDVLAVGEMLIDIVSRGQLTDRSWSLQANPGGAPANVAVGVSRLGRRAGFLGAISSDFFGDWLREILEQEGVDHRFITLCQEPTTLAFVRLKPGGDRDFTFHRERTSDVSLRAEDIPDAAIQAARAIHVCSVSLSRSPAREATRSAVRRAREAGVFVSFDVNLRPRLWHDLEEAKRLIYELLAEADFIKVNEEELSFLTPDERLESLVRSVPANGRRVLWVLTRGRGRATFVCDGVSDDVEGFPVEAVDTTGAGDAFTAALLVRLADDGFSLTETQKLPATLRFAHAAAALSVRHYGAIPALPAREEVIAFLQERCP